MSTIAISVSRYQNTSHNSPTANTSRCSRRVAGSPTAAGASPLPAELLYRNADDGSWRFLSAQVYRKVLAGAGMHRISPGIVYCNTGQYAAGAWFVVHRIMGVKGLREYPGGMNEWEQRGLPVEAF